jgi:hypothetical protein
MLPVVSSSSFGVTVENYANKLGAEVVGSAITVVLVVSSSSYGIAA